MALNISTTAAKGLLRSGAALAYYATGHHKRAHRGSFTVLMYHRVLKNDDPYIPYLQPGMFVRESSFERQLSFLSAKYRIVSFQQMLELIEARQVSSDHQYCVITFDDGWLDNYEVAFPILKKYSAPATIFLTAGFVGTHRFFWHEKVSRLFYLARSRIGSETGMHSSLAARDEHAAALLRCIGSRSQTAEAVDRAIEGLKALPVAQIEEIVERAASALQISFAQQRTMLSWEEIKEMGACGISFGSHTCEHRILTQIDIRDAATEIEGSLEQLRSRDLNFIPVFCYPNGRYNDAVRSLVIEAGYAAAVTTKAGRESGQLKDPFSIPRIGIHDDIAHSKALLSLRLR